MENQSHLSTRKADHIRINLEKDVQSRLRNGLEKYHFSHRALPELNLEDVDLSQELFGRKLRTPILISSITGGTAEAKEINKTLAAAAQIRGVAMGIGSQRAAIENPELETTFKVRDVAPDILLFANLGAVQLNYRYGIDECRRAVEMIDADVLYLHLNPLQEAFQPEGDVHFRGLLNKIESVCRVLEKPVVIKEVGWGISGEDAKRLWNVGVAGIDVAGAGGTSWSQVERYRIADENLNRVAEAFIDWGIPTAESLIEVHKAIPEALLIASGGLRHGVDIAKCIALGASMGGMAGRFLKTAVQSVEDTVKLIDEISRAIQITMFVTGCRNLSQLRQENLKKMDDENL